MGNSFGFSAEAGGFGFTAGASTEISKDKKEGSTNMKSFAKASTYTIGCDLPEGATVKEKLQNWVANKETIAKDP